MPSTRRPRRGDAQLVDDLAQRLRARRRRSSGGRPRRGGGASARSRTRAPGPRPLPRPPDRCRAARGRRSGRSAVAGEQRGRCAAAAALPAAGTAPRPVRAGRRTKRSIWCGIGSSACSGPACRARRALSCSASAKPPLGMKGNGCAGSMASGESTGKTCSRNTSREGAVLGGQAPSRVSTGCPRASISLAQLAQQVCWCCISLRASALISTSCSAGVSPSIGRGVLPAAPARAGPRRARCRTRRGCWPRSTGSAPAPAAARAGSRPPPARAS
jgi:hypothetical protein